MILSALRTKPPFRLVSLHVRAHQDGHCEFNLLPRPAQLNVLADEFASEVLADLRAADQPTGFYSLPACRVYLRDVTGHITSCEKRTLTNKFPEYEIRAYLQQRNGWTTHTLDPINWTAYQAAISGLTDQVGTVVMLSNSVVTGYLLAFGNTDTALQMPPARNAFNSKQYAICRTNWRNQFIDKLTKHPKDASIAVDLRCIIVEGIQKWFRTDDTNKPDEPDHTTQLGWYQVIKGYLPN
jgi:hypothetical protein